VAKPEFAPARRPEPGRWWRQAGNSHEEIFGGFAWFFGLKNAARRKFENYCQHGVHYKFKERKIKIL
jgi:hypothetical protein